MPRDGEEELVVRDSETRHIMSLDTLLACSLEAAAVCCSPASRIPFSSFLLVSAPSSSSVTSAVSSGPNPPMKTNPDLDSSKIP